ncbi:hypothetical protein D3C72_1562370 [compost metagenome]
MPSRAQRRHSLSIVSLKLRRLATPVSESVSDSSRMASACRLMVSWLRTRARTTAALNGFVMKSTAPASSARVSSSGWFRAVTKMTGMALRMADSRSALHTA